MASLSAAVGCNSKSGAPDGGSGAGGVGGASGGGSGGGAGGANGGAGGVGARGGSGAAGGSTAACAFAATYTLLDWSGPDTDDVTRLSPPNSYYYQGETAFAVDGGVSFPFCDPTAPACNSATRVDVSDVEAAIAHPDVQAALAMTTAPVYGNFTGLPDANNHLLSFSRSSGGGFNCSNDCPTPAGSCTPIPPGIKALVALLRQLKTELRADPACAGVH